MIGGRFVISGCSGGGKSSLLAELYRRGCSMIEEPGRRVIAKERAADGDATPWDDSIAFAKRLVAMAREDLIRSASLPEPIFFDRGRIDAAAALETLAGVPVSTSLGGDRPYCRRVFLLQPWPEIYEQDEDRRHPLSVAEAEYDNLARLYPSLGYEPVLVPKRSVSARADFVLAAIA